MSSSGFNGPQAKGLEFSVTSSCFAKECFRRPILDEEESGACFTWRSLGEE